jgi:hypothetical protein
VAVPASAVQQILMAWATLFEAKYHEKPIITGKDGAAVKRLLGHAPAPVVLRRLQVYLDLDDPFITNQGYPLALMLGAWNRLVAQDRPERAKVPDASATANYLAKMRGQR